MKKPILILALILSANAQATSLNWENSPYNYKNMDITYDNSSMKWDNNPLNYRNNELNYNQRNGIYDNDGDQVGYKVRRLDGVTNYFDDTGYRMGYSDE